MLIKVAIKNLEDHEVDVIVNSTNTDLNFSMGYVSKALLQKAGLALQQVAKQQYPGAMKAGEILVTNGYGLSCKHVVHSVIPRSVRGINNVEKFTFDCMKKAAALHCRSIAFPALGTGHHGYKPKHVAKAMFAAVDDFDTKCKDSGLEEVHFVLYHKDAKVIKAFEKRMKQRADTTIERAQTPSRVEANYKKCWICDEKGSLERACFYCENCNKHFCGICNDYHKRFQPFHVVVDGVESGQRQARQDDNSDVVSTENVASNKYRSRDIFDEDRIPLIAGGSTERMQSPMDRHASEAARDPVVRDTSFECHSSIDKPMLCSLENDQDALSKNTHNITKSQEIEMSLMAINKNHPCNKKHI